MSFHTYVAYYILFSVYVQEDLPVVIEKKTSIFTSPIFCEFIFLAVFTKFATKNKKKCPPNCLTIRSFSNTQPLPQKQQTKEHKLTQHFFSLIRFTNQHLIF